MEFGEIEQEIQSKDYSFNAKERFWQRIEGSQYTNVLFSSLKQLGSLKVCGLMQFGWKIKEAREKKKSNAFGGKQIRGIYIELQGMRKTRGKNKKKVGKNRKTNETGDIKELARLLDFRYGGRFSEMPFFYLIIILLSIFLP